jgi:NAD(P)H-hydrate epimerase
MKVVTAEQMREIDRVTIEERGIPGEQLMERAGRAVAFEIMERFEPGPAAVVAGKGNNAGDGFVVARYLAQREWPVTVFLLGNPDDLTGDALRMYKALPESARQARIEKKEELADALREYELIIDAILGTGVKGAVRGLFGEAIEAINESGLPVVAVDIPSGMPTDGGAIEGPVVRAAHTVTIGLPKLGMVIEPGIRFTGTVNVASIDFPADLLNNPNIQTNLLTEEMIRAALPERPPDGHKGTFGSVMVIGGAPGMTGAPVMAARSAMRSGVGLVYCATPQAIDPLVTPRLLEELTLSVPSEDGRHFDLTSIQAIRDRVRDMKAAAIGPGIGRAPGTQAFVRKAVEEIELPMVIDADALNALGGHLDVLHERKACTVLTPHPGEMATLTGLTTAQVQSDRIGAAQRLAANFGVVVVLKGAQTIVSDPDGSVYINPTGNTGLAKGGSGDVLTGLIGGLLAQTGKALESAICGVFLHGLAADLAADTIPPRAMIPSDVIEYLPKAVMAVMKI